VSKHTNSQSSNAASKAPINVKSKSGKRIAAIKGTQTDDPQHEVITAELEPELHHHMIEIAAYYRAEQRGFQGGNPLDDWLAAEAEIGAHLST
jgi:Protein of unknown function (DUF2934)